METLTPHRGVYEAYCVDPRVFIPLFLHQRHFTLPALEFSSQHARRLCVWLCVYRYVNACVYLYTHVCIFVHIYLYAFVYVSYVHICVTIYKHMHVHVSVHTHVRTYLNMCNLYMYLHMPLCTNVCLCPYMCVFVTVYMWEHMWVYILSISLLLHFPTYLHLSFFLISHSLLIKQDKLFIFCSIVSEYYSCCL